MVTSVKKSGRHDKAVITGFKVPLLDLYLVRGAEIRRLQKSKTIRGKMMARLLHEKGSLRKRLARYED